jgi:hypothetical protein
MLGRGGWLCRRRDSDDPNARENEQEHGGPSTWTSMVNEHATGTGGRSGCVLNWRKESVHLSQDSVADEWVLGDVDIGSVEATDARPRRRLRW